MMRSSNNNTSGDGALEGRTSEHEQSNNPCEGTSVNNSIVCERVSEPSDPIPNLSSVQSSAGGSGSCVSSVPSATASMTSASSRQCSSKGFHTFDSLRFERERLNTYIHWPLSWLSPASLAKEGLYYLRDRDHVSCVFCRGIIGAWELGDIPKQEHKRHFPNCPFVKGMAVGNVPLAIGDMLAAVPRRNLCTEDSCRASGAHRYAHNIGVCISSDSSKLKHKCDISPRSATKENPLPGLHMHSPPKRADYITYESRLKTFSNWPSNVKQEPKALAEAGFFHCGLSDHVRCYHCGNGLRNWEDDDDPWVEHARWYPNCDFVLTVKGIEFIDTVSRVNPPYIPMSVEPKTSQRNGACSSSSISSSQNVILTLSEQQLDKLMELDIVKAALRLDFPVIAVRSALKHKIETTGLPFFDLEHCVEQIVIAENQASREAQRGQSSKLSRYNDEMSRRGSDVPPQRTQQNSLTSQEHVASSSASSNIATADTHGDDAADSNNTEVTPNERATANTSMESEDIVEYPLHRGQSDATQTSGTGSMESLTSSSDEDATPTNYDPATTSTPRHSPVSPEMFATDLPSMLSDTSMQSTSSSRSEDTLASSGFNTESSNPSGSFTTEVAVSVQSAPLVHYDDETSMEIMNQVDDVIIRAQKEQMKVLRNLSSSSSTTSGHKCLSCDEDETEEESETKCKSISSIEDSSTSSFSSSSDVESASVKKLQKRIADLEKELERMNDQRTCRVCMDAEMSLVFLPCHHMATCATCGVAMTACPICRADIVHIIRPNIVS